MRLRITRQPAGCVDGIRLDELVVGLVYEIGTTLGCYLLAEGFAEPVDEETPALIPPWSGMRFTVITPSSEESEPQTTYPDELSEAADRPPRKPGPEHGTRESTDK